MEILKRFCIVLGIMLLFHTCYSTGVFIMKTISPNDSIFQESVFKIYTTGLFVFIAFLGILKIIEFIYNVIKYILTGKFYEE